MNTNNFLKFRDKDFFADFMPSRPKTYCIMIVYMNGHKYEKRDIQNPWKYIAALKKNPEIKDAYIKTENNC